MKREVKITCIMKNLIVEKSSTSKKEYKITMKQQPNKGVCINYLIKDTLEVKKNIKLILK